MTSAFARLFAPASGPASDAPPPAAPSGPSTSSAERTASAPAPPAAAAAAAPAPAAAPAVQVVEHGYDSPEPDLYRTFSPSEVAFWDLKAPADGQSGSGFFAKFFGAPGAAKEGGASDSK
jgi:hypothetical protein